MFDNFPPSHDVARAKNQQMSTICSCYWADHVLGKLGPEGLARLFDGILTAGLGRSFVCHAAGVPLGYPYFMQEDSWMPAVVGQQFLVNMQAMGLNLETVGRETALYAIRNRSVLELRLLSIGRLDLILRALPRMAERFSRTFTLSVAEIGRDGCVLVATYQEGIGHTDHNILYTRGFIAGCLDYMGFKDIRVSIVADNQARSGGFCVFSFHWDGTRLPPCMRSLKTDIIRLTPREHQLLQLLTEGCTVKELCFLSDLKYETVKFHLTNARKKLGCRTRDEMVARFVELGARVPVA